jgi:hypothetical protein
MEEKCEKKPAVLEELYRELDANMDICHQHTNDILLKICKIQDIREPKPEDRDIKEGKSKDPNCFVDLLEGNIRSLLVLKDRLRYISEKLDGII